MKQTETKDGETTYYGSWMAFQRRVHLPEGEEMFLGQQSHLTQGSVQNGAGMAFGQDKPVTGGVLGRVN